MLGILLGQHLRQRAHHDPRVVERLPGQALAAAQGARVVGDQERARAALAHRRQHLLGDQERPAAGDVLRGVEHLDRDVLQQLLLGRQVAPLQVAGVVDQHLRVAGLARGSWRRPPRWSPATPGPARRSCTRRPARGWPPPAPTALAAVRVVSTTKKPSLANFWAMAPPMPQRMPTGRSLSSSALPCASLVLRPSACHLEVAPTTTATGLPLLFRFPAILKSSPAGARTFG